MAGGQCQEDARWPCPPCVPSPAVAPWEGVGEGSPVLSQPLSHCSQGATEVPPPQIQQGAALLRSRLLFLLQHRGFAAGLGREREHHSPPGGLSSTKPYRGGHLRIPQRPLYPGLQTLSPVLPPGSAGIPNHSLSGFPFLAPAQAGKSWPRAPGGSKTPSHAPLLTFHPLLGRVWGWRGPTAPWLPSARPPGFVAAPAGHGSAGVRRGLGTRDSTGQGLATG